MELGTVTDKISSQVRTTAVAVLALIWGLLIGDSTIAKDMPTELRPTLIVLAMAAIFVLLLDFLQYFAGYLSTKRVLDEMERADATEGHYDYESLPWRLRKLFFWAKQVVLMLTFFALFVLVLGYFGPEVFKG